MNLTRSCMHVDPLPSGIRSGRYTVPRKWTGHPHWRKRNGIVFFDLPETLAAGTVWSNQPDIRHDLWLRASIFPAMEAGRDLHIHGPVSRTLLANLEIYQRIIADWWPDKYQAVQLHADEEIDAPAPPTAAKAVLTFSGGLDSIYSLYCHHRSYAAGTHGVSRCACWCTATTSADG